jgi:hypothetical protein
MDAAVWGFLGVVVGGLVTGAITIWAQWLRGRQEADLDTAKRLHDHRLGRDAFQQANLVELQVVLDEWVGMEIGRIEDVASGEDVPDPAVRAADAATRRLAYLTERVTDDELRERLSRIRKTAWSSCDQDALAEARARLADEARRAQEQLGELLRSYL